MSNLFQRPVWAEIDLSAIKNNVREIKKVIGDKKIIGVIKANAYGHGAVETGKALKEEGVNFFAVAILEEALELRRAGFEDEILILGWTPSEDYQKCLENNLILCLYDYEEGTRLNEKARELNTTARVHIKIDTGMSRIGFLPNEKSFQEILKIMDLGNISVEGIFSHLSKADEKNKSYAEHQIKVFSDFTGKIENQIGKKITWKHISNSAAILDLPKAHFNMVRAGIILYGLKPSDEVCFEDKNFIPAMTLKARLSRVEKIPKNSLVSYGGLYEAPEDTQIGTIPIGYADGYTRLLTGKGQVLVKGEKRNILGKICMDQCMVDLHGIENIHKGDEVILMGGGNIGESADDIAKKLGTINYEVVCMISERVPRKYLD